MENVVRILSIDGGGVKGLIPAVLLQEIESKAGKPINELFDMFAGTSTGGIMSLLLNDPNKNYTTKDVIEFYTGDAVKKIFKKRLIRFPLDAVKYPCENIESVLKEKFSESLFKDTIKPVLIQAYDTQSGDSKFFYSKEDKSAEFKFWEMARATSAAETFFPPFKLANMCLIDGGNFANNPSLFALIEAQKQFPDCTNFEIVSLGCGTVSMSTPYEQLKKWNIIDWASNIFGITSDGQSDTVSYSMSRLKSVKSFKRFQITLTPDQADMDNVNEDHLKELINITNFAINNQWKDSLEELISDLRGGIK